MHDFGCVGNMVLFPLDSPMGQAIKILLHAPKGIYWSKPANTHYESEVTSRIVELLFLQEIYSFIHLMHLFYVFSFISFFHTVHLCFLYLHSFFQCHFSILVIH